MSYCDESIMMTHSILHYKISVYIKCMLYTQMNNLVYVNNYTDIVLHNNIDYTMTWIA